MRTRTAIAAAITGLLCAFVLSACGGSSGPTSLDDGGDGPPTAVASVEVVEGASLEVPVQAVSDTVVAVLRDANGNPVAGDLASFEIEGEGEDVCGFWDASTLQARDDGKVFNVLHSGEVAWTGVQGPFPCRYRVVHSSEGAPEPVLDSVQVRVLPGPPVRLRALRTYENETLEADGDRSDGRVTLQEIWIDSLANPTPYTIQLTGPVHKDSLPDRREWLREVVPEAPGSGTIKVWSAPDSAESVEGTVEVTPYGPDGEELHLCVSFPEGSGGLAECDGPPDL